MRLVLSLFVFCLFSPLLGSSQVLNQWVKKSDFGGLQRERCVGFSIGNLGYVCSGTDTSETVRNDLWSYDPSSDTWTQKASLPGSVRRNAVAVSLNGLGYVGTGADSSSAQNGTLLKDWWAYNPVSNSWSQRADYPGGTGNGIYFATAFALDGKAFVCGGKIASATYIPELWAYDPDLDHWFRFSDFPGGVRQKLCSVTVGDTAYVGLGIDDDVYRKDWWAYLADLDVWIPRTDFPGGERSSVSTFSIVGRAYICLGENGGFKKDLWEYNPKTDSWLNRANFGGQERRYAVGFSIGDKAYVGTGQGTTGKKRSFYEYNPAALSVENNELEQVAIYPNPSSGQLRIDFPEYDNYSIAVYDASGKLVYSERLNAGFWERNLDKLSPGLYTVLLEGKEKKTAKRWLVY